MSRPIDFYEGYKINYDYQKDDGYWVVGLNVDVYIPVNSATEKEKNNHDKASQAFLNTHKMMKNIRINSVKYI